jgi:hypothetical protein
MVTGSQIALGIFAALCFLGITFHLTRRRLLSERISLVWLGISIGLLAPAVFPGLAFKVAEAMGFKVTSNAIFTFAVLLLLAFNLFVTTRISVLDQRLRRLAQDQALAMIEGGSCPTAVRPAAEPDDT